MGLVSRFNNRYCSQVLVLRKTKALRVVYHKALEGSHTELYRIILNIRFVKLVEIYILNYRPDIPNELKKISDNLKQYLETPNLWTY